MRTTAVQSAPRAQDEPIVTGGKVHVRQAAADGVTYRVEMQFFKTHHAGQCWNGLGRDSAGRIYLGNSTHFTNSFVYRLDPKTGQMCCLGDLLSNIRHGGRGGSDNGKIHCPFFEGPGGDIFFLSHCGSGNNIRYGGHLWKYDVRAERIVDLGVPMPGNTNFCISEPRDGVTYTCSTPSGMFIRCDLNTLEFTVVEKTDMNYVRHMPAGADGRLYIAWANRIRQFDPKVGHWQVVARNPETDPDRVFGPVPGFCWNRDRSRLYFVSHIQGNFFCWPVGSPTVEPLGKLHPDRQPIYLHNIRLNPAQNRLYGMGGSAKKTDKGFYVYDLSRRKSHKLFSLDDIVAHELAEVTRGEAFVDFTDFGNVTGDDGTMYYGFHGGDVDQDHNPGGNTVVALIALRVTDSESGSAAAAPPGHPIEVPPAGPIPPDAAVREPSGPGQPPRPLPDGPVSDSVTPVWPNTQGPLSTGAGVVTSYRMAARPEDSNSEGQFPLAYWVGLRADPAAGDSRDVLLYVHVGEIDNGPDRYMARETVNVLPASRTAHDPWFDRYLVRGRRLRYRGRLTPASADQPACVDTAVPGGSVQIVFEAERVEKLADFTVGKTVVFEGVIEPRKPWVDGFEGEDWWQDWQLVVTLPGGQTVDIGDRLLVESYDFLRCLALMRDSRAVKVRVVGQVWDAGPLKEARTRPRGAPGSPRDVRGDILVAVEELVILGDA